MKLFFTLSFFLAVTLIFGQTHFYVANRDGHNVLRFSMNGDLIEEFVTSGSGGLSSPQDVLFHPVDGSLIVTGFNNNAIKKYDGVSGDFIGNFSNGFNLNRPTKMNIGADNLLYVAQWGNPTSKIVRFDLDGNFVDEWSEIDVPEGCGMEWDSEGNLYICTWSNGLNNGTAGFVRKFDKDGNDLGIIVNSSILQGPVGIWIDEKDVLFVIDWTMGRVSKFDINGNFIEHFITGMQRTEGDAIGPDGKYYLCDWQGNRVNRYNADGSFDTNLINTGLNIPNGLTFGPDDIMSNTDNLRNNSSALSVYPNPVSDQISFEYTSSNTGKAALEIHNNLGKLIFTKTLDISTTSNIFTIELKSLASGSYYICISLGDKITTSSFVK